MSNLSHEKIIHELKKEYAFFLDLWKDSSPTESGSLLNKIKDIERKINELEKLNLSHLSIINPNNNIETNEIDIDFEELFKDYFNFKNIEILQEDWPYEIEKSLFVSNFDFKIGSFEERNIINNSNCVDYIKNTITNKSIICIAFYGMGKTAIAKYTFATWNNFKSYPLFISLNKSQLHSFQEITKLIFDIVRDTLYNVDFDKYIKVLGFNEQLIKNHISKYVQERKITLIIDGIDEAITTRTELELFSNYLKNTQLKVLLTCRLEFNPFFDIFSTKTDYTYVELLPWGENQWNNYSNALIEKYPSYKNKIIDFKTKLHKYVYKELPTRPLFLKILSDLLINNKTKITLNQKLEGNRAEIYLKFIIWKISDDYYRKGGNRTDVTFDFFLIEILGLLKKLAVIEYNKFIGNINTNILISDNIKLETQSSIGYGFSLYEITEISKYEHFIFLTSDYIAINLMNSSLFAIFKKLDSKNYTFSHKSFIEYLLCSSIVDSIFSKNTQNSSCPLEWSFYQTSEIVDHIENEIQRISVENNLDDYNRNIFLRIAFEKELKEIKIEDYEERIRNTIFYCGKYRVKSEFIISTLITIVDNPKFSNAIYLRTAFLALSRIIDFNYMLDYIDLLISSIKTDNLHAEINMKIEMNYFGEIFFHQKQIPYIDLYIENGDYSNYNLLRIFSFFTIPTSSQDGYDTEYLLKKIELTAMKHCHSEVLKICNFIKQNEIKWRL